jgi:hypothetical protein
MFWDLITDFLAKRNREQPQGMNSTVRTMAEQIDRQHDALLHPDLPPAAVYGAQSLFCRPIKKGASRRMLGALAVISSR